MRLSSSIAVWFTSILGASSLAVGPCEPSLSSLTSPSCAGSFTPPPSNSTDVTLEGNIPSRIRGQRYGILGHADLYSVQPTWSLTHLHRKEILKSLFIKAVDWFSRECKREYTSGSEETYHTWGLHFKVATVDRKLWLRFEKPMAKTGLSWEIVLSSFETIKKLVRDDAIPSRETYWNIYGPDIQQGVGPYGQRQKIIGKASIVVYEDPPSR